ncbi:MAG: hypothetical protein JWQ84_3069 [Mucilaginibacter sp.]|nr:hypothetical protein [Mucilaginibacter sp.]MDB5139632.1 hypothetical protein [Mucilaginibacter sp.]
MRFSPYFQFFVIPHFTLKAKSLKRSLSYFVLLFTFIFKFAFCFSLLAFSSIFKQGILDAFQQRGLVRDLFHFIFGFFLLFGRIK